MWVKISFSESQYLYSVRLRTGLGYAGLGAEQTLADAINKIYIIMGVLRKEPSRAA